LLWFSLVLSGKRWERHLKHGRYSLPAPIRRSIHYIHGQWNVVKQSKRST
jgi:hypothetical protein